MAICSLCEHPQAGGDVCLNCGRQFAPASEEAAALAAPMPELQSTRLVDRPITARAPPIEGLERTAIEDSDASPEAVGEVPDLEATRLAPPGAPTETAWDAEVSCRVCATVQPTATTRVCVSCGVRVGSYMAPSKAGDAVEAKVCRDCGQRVRGSRCSACGAQVRDHS